MRERATFRVIGLGFLGCGDAGFGRWRGEMVAQEPQLHLVGGGKLGMVLHAHALEILDEPSIFYDAFGDGIAKDPSATARVEKVQKAVANVVTGLGKVSYIPGAGGGWLLSGDRGNQ